MSPSPSLHQSSNSSTLQDVEVLKQSIRALVQERNEIRNTLRIVGGKQHITSAGRGGLRHDYCHGNNKYNNTNSVLHAGGFNYSLNQEKRGVKRVKPETLTCSVGQQDITPLPNDKIDINNESYLPPSQSPEDIMNEGLVPASSVTLSLEQFTIEKRPVVVQDPPTIKRTRNLFSSLLGHLKKAKVQLDGEKETKQAVLHKKVEAQVDQKLEVSKRNLLDQRKKAFKDKRMLDIERMKTVQRELMLKETELLRCNLEHHYEQMSNYIRTEAHPMIFWLPAIHTDVTRRLQEETHAQIERKLESLKDKFSTDPSIARDENGDDDNSDENDGAEIGTNLLGDGQSDLYDGAEEKGLSRNLVKVHPGLLDDGGDGDELIHEECGIGKDESGREMVVDDHNDGKPRGRDKFEKT